MKKFFAGLLGFSLCIVISAGAVSLPESTVNGLSNEDIHSLFDDKKGSQIINAQGNDVTQTFIKNHIKDYNNGSYEDIKDALADESLSIITPLNTNIDSSKRMMLNKVAVAYNVKANMKNSKTGRETGDWATFNIYAEYRVYDSTGTIESGGTVRYEAVDNSYPGYIPFVSSMGGGGYQISADKKTIYFNVNWKVDFTMKYTGQGVGIAYGSTSLKGNA